MQSLTGKITGDSLTATEWNQLPAEVQNVITGLGITLASGDLNQLGKAIAGYVANGQFYTDSGAADAYVLSTVGSKQAPSAYTTGARFIFVPGNTNTGASTVNAGGLGVKNIKTRDGRDPAAGVIQANQGIVLEYDGTNAVIIGSVGTEASAEILPFTFASDANDTLTDGENRYSRIEISGATLTAARTLTVAGLPRRLSVSNGEGFAVTVQGGTGVPVPTGESLELYYDGTNVVVPENVIGDGISTLSKTTVIAGSAKAFVNFNGTGTVAITDSYNVSSITDNGVGDYTVNFTTAFANTNYAAFFGGHSAGAASSVSFGYSISGSSPITKTVSALRAFSANGGAAFDFSDLAVAIHAN